MKAHLVTALLAASLGIGGTLAAGGAPEAHAWADSKKVHVSKTFAATNPVLQNIWSSVDASMCAEAEGQMGWESGTCSVEPGTVLSIIKGVDEDRVEVNFQFATTSVKGSVE